MQQTSDLKSLSAAQLHALVSDLTTQVSERDAATKRHDASINNYATAIQRYEIRERQLTHEIALLKRHRFGQRSEHLDSRQQSLLDDHIDADIAAMDTELEKLSVGGETKPKTSNPNVSRYRLSSPAP